MRNLAVLILISFLFTGCIRKSSIVHLKPNTKVSSDCISILIPDSYPKNPFYNFGANQSDRIYITRNIPNMMRENIDIYCFNIKNNHTGLKALLHKDKNKTFDKEYTNRYLSDWEMSNYLERRVNYSKQYINFVGKLKCTEDVQSSNIADGVGSKKYSLSCPYYDKQGDKKFIHVMANMYLTFDRTKFVGSDSPSLVKHKLLDIEKQFKMDMREVLDSLEIYNIDIERMQKDELLYNKKYDIEAESKAKDLTFNCEYTSDNVLCEGKEIDRKCSRKRSKDSKWECE